MPFRLTLLSLLVGGIAVGCNSNSSQRTPVAAPPTSVATFVSPPGAPGPPPTAVPTLAPLLQSRGWLVYLRGKDLFVGDLATGQEQQLTSGSLGAGFAGYAGYETRVSLYYTTLIEQAPQNDRSLGLVQVSRRRIDGGAAENLFTFRPTRASTDGNPLAHAASAAPDGTAIAYADDTGIHRYDVASGATTTLLANPCQAEPRPEKGCVTYINPQWSPDGRWLLASKLLYEGSVSVVIGADDPASMREFPDVGGDVQSWAPDSRYFCAFNTTFQPGGTHIVPPHDGVRYRPAGRLADAKSADGANIFTSACIWSAANALALTYSVGPPHDQWRFAVFSAAPFAEVISDNAMPPVFTHAAVWLPDASGVIIVRQAGEEAPYNLALLLDGSTRRLPLATDGQVVGTIPQL